MPRPQQKILMLLSNPFEPDPRVYKEARSLLRAGFELEILAWDRERKFPHVEIIEGIPVRRIQSKGSYGTRLRSIADFLRFYWQALVHIKKTKPDAIHCHDLDTAILGWLATRFLHGKVFVYDAHEPEYYLYFPGILKKMINRFERALTRSADYVLATNSIQLRKFEGQELRHIELIRNVPEQNIVALVDSKQELKGYPIIGRIGFITDHLGLESLCEAADMLRSDYPGTRVVLIGKIHPQFIKKFEHLRQRYDHILQHIGFIKYPQAMSYYKYFTISYMLYDTHSYYRFATPTKLFESMAFGVPCLVSPIGDVEEILQKYPCGILLPSLSASDIYEALETLLSEDRVVNQMKANGVQAFRSELNWETEEQKLNSLYINTLSKSK